MRVPTPWKSAKNFIVLIYSLIYCFIDCHDREGSQLGGPFRLYGPSGPCHNHSTPLLHPESSHQFSSIAQSCPTLCNPMDYSMPGFPVHHQLSEPARYRYVYRYIYKMYCVNFQGTKCLHTPTNRSFTYYHLLFIYRQQAPPLLILYMCCAVCECH